jgi:hypothetical protein
VREGLEQAEKIRAGLADYEKERGVTDEDRAWWDTADLILSEIYPVNARRIVLDTGKVAVEIYIERGRPDLVEGFSDYIEADRWIRDKADAYAVANGAPAGTKVIKIQ